MARLESGKGQRHQGQGSKAKFGGFSAMVSPVTRTSMTEYVMDPPIQDRAAGAAKKIAGVAKAAVAPVTGAVSRYKELNQRNQDLPDPKANVKPTQKPAGMLDKLGRKIGQGAFAAKNRDKLAMTQGKGRIGSFIQGFKQPVESKIKGKTNRI